MFGAYRAWAKQGSLRSDDQGPPAAVRCYVCGFLRTHLSILSILTKATTQPPTLRPLFVHGACGVLHPRGSKVRPDFCTSRLEHLSVPPSQVLTLRTARPQKVFMVHRPYWDSFVIENWTQQRFYGSFDP